MKREVILEFFKAHPNQWFSIKEIESTLNLQGIRPIVTDMVRLYSNIQSKKVHRKINGKPYPVEVFCFVS